MEDRLRFPPSPTQDITKVLGLDRAQVGLCLKRDDLIDAEITGNKARKLKYNCDEVARLGFPKVVTVGGAYSNHLLATAVAGARLGFSTIGLVRGEEHLPLNEILAEAKDRGMTFEYIDRTRYRDRNSDQFIQWIHDEFGSDCFYVPEGGSNCLGLKGAAEIVPEITEPFDVICCSCGTGGTLAGIVTALPPQARAIGISALKGGEFLVSDVERLLTTCRKVASGPWEINTEFHFGGFAKQPQELRDFAADFAGRTGIDLDPVYEGKMMFGLLAMIRRGDFPSGTTIVAVHGGGGSSGGPVHSTGSRLS
ncbi:MAG: pyridoxal-phosphate dependent enzyme [Acidimicrobiales bacterium]